MCIFTVLCIVIANVSKFIPFSRLRWSLLVFFIAGNFSNNTLVFRSQLLSRPSCFYRWDSDGSKTVGMVFSFSCIFFSSFLGLYSWAWRRVDKKKEWNGLLNSTQERINDWSTTASKIIIKSIFFYYSANFAKNFVRSTTQNSSETNPNITIKQITVWHVSGKLDVREHRGILEIVLCLAEWAKISIWKQIKQCLN